MITLLQGQPEFTTKSTLIIEALAPLSLVTNMPGKFYRSQSAPTDQMLYGMLENALGWHLSPSDRDKLLKQLEKRLGKSPQRPGNNYRSLLHYHVSFAPKLTPSDALSIHYVDYWSRQLHGTGTPFVGGSREYSAEAIPIMNAIKADQIKVNDLASANKDPRGLHDFKTGDVIHLNVLRAYFPQFYVSPSPREYIIPSLPYFFEVTTSESIANELAQAISNPAAPLYLGSNDGWVEVTWKTH